MEEKKIKAINHSSKDGFILISEKTLLATMFGLNLALQRISEIEKTNLGAKMSTVSFLSLRYVQSLTDQEVAKEIEQIISSQKPGANLF